MSSRPYLPPLLAGRALVAALILSTGCSRTTSPPPPEKSELAEPNQGEPELAKTEPQPAQGSANSAQATAPSVLELTGSEILEQIRNSKAEFTLLNAWASWCGPCRVEFPMLVALADNMKARGLDIRFVSMDEPESVPVAVEFAENNGLALPIVVAKRPLGEFKQAIHAGWPGMLPATFLFDSDGTLKHFWAGPVYEHELLPILEQALSGQDVQGETRFGLSPGKDLRND